MKGLEIHDVLLSYDTVQVLDHVSLSVEDGEIVAVLGPSGSGKSSLLRVVAGLIPTASGSVSVKNIDVTGLPTHKRGVGMVFQNNQLFPHLNVEENVGYGLRVARVKRGVIAERVAGLLSLVGLESHAKRDVATLSGGEAARVALARSLATEPAVLLLDEPLSGLDHDLKYPLADELRHVIKTAGITAVIVTHDPVEAERIADRTVRMSELSSTTR